VNVIVWVIGRVKLNNPINFREIKTTLGDICAKQNARLSLTEFKVGRCTFLLLLLPVDVLDRNVNVIQQIRVKLYSVAT